MVLVYSCYERVECYQENSKKCLKTNTITLVLPVNVEISNYMYGFNFLENEYLITVLLPIL